MGNPIKLILLIKNRIKRETFYLKYLLLLISTYFKDNMC